MVLCLGMAAAFATGPAFAGETETSPVAATSATSPNDSKATDLARPNANHNLLGELAGTWNYVLKISIGPNKPPIETNGVVVRQPIMGGRYFLADFDRRDASRQRWQTGEGELQRQIYRRLRQRETELHFYLDRQRQHRADDLRR
jgi:hypothetical protein